MQDNNTLKSGKCPKCGSEEVYTTRGEAKRGERFIIPISSMRSFSLDTYICASCGNFEEYIPDEDIKDEKKIEKLKETWKKVK